MALIIEVLRPGRGDEVRERLRLGEGPVTIGRALDNTLVLDDPHVDAHHARILRAADGSFEIEDLGSVNRIGGSTGDRHDRIAIGHGIMLTLGHTPLRIRDDAAPVAAAVPLAAATIESREEARWYQRGPGRAAIVGGTIAFAAFDQWLGSPERGAASSAFATVLSASALAIVWTGIWSVASRAVLGQFRFLAHLTVAALAYLGFALTGAFVSWGRFLLPGTSVFAPLMTGALLALLAAVVAGHLASASHLARAARWRAGAASAAIVLVLVGVSAALDDDAFTPAAEFPGMIKPITPALIPKQSVEEFTASMNELRTEVDSLLAMQDR